MKAISTPQTDVILNASIVENAHQRKNKSWFSSFLVAAILLVGAAYGLAAQCVQFVNCPTNRVEYACFSNCVPVNFTITATNYCNPTNLVVLTDYPSGYCFPVGTTWVHATAYGSGQSNTCSFTVTVLSNCPPPCLTLQCPPDITTNICDASSVPLFFKAFATNNCNPADLTVVYNPPQSSSFTPGVHTVYCTAYGSGQSKECSFTITVTTNCPPPLTNCLDLHCSTNIIRYVCDTNCLPVYYSVWAENLCNPNDVSLVTYPPSGSTFCLGTTTVDAWAYGSGQTNHCSFTVTVLPDPNCGGNGDCSTNLLKNGSFENPGVPDGYVALAGGDSVISGWVTALNGVEYYNPVVAPLFVNTGFAADGVYLLDLAPASAVGGGIQQTFATIPGRSHRVSFAMGTSKERGRNGTASLTVTVAGTAHAFNVSTSNPTITWERKAFSFVATSSTTTLVFSTMDDPALSFVNLDDVWVSDCCTDPGLKIKPTVTVEWNCDILQSAPEVTGPYTDVTGATSPYTTTTTGLQRYFRTR